MMTRWQYAATVLCALAFLIIGITCLFWTERVAEYGLKVANSGPGSRFNPFLGWMRTRQYIWSLRSVGIVSLLALAILLVALAKASR